MEANRQGPAQSRSDFSPRRVLVLNASFEPLKIISWQRAMLLFLGDKIEVLDSYDDVKIHSPSQSFPLPSVIKLKRYISLRQKTRVLKFSRQHVFLRDDFTCQYCFDQFVTSELTLDHVLPVARGGKKTWSNIVTCCRNCNQRKGAMTPAEAGYEDFNFPREPRSGYLPDILYFKGRFPEPWRPYLSWVIAGAKKAAI